jgi:hypothetical protein
MPGARSTPTRCYIHTVHMRTATDSKGRPKRRGKVAQAQNKHGSASEAAVRSAACTPPQRGERGHTNGQPQERSPHLSPAESARDDSETTTPAPRTAVTARAALRCRSARSARVHDARRAHGGREPGPPARTVGPRRAGSDQRGLVVPAGASGRHRRVAQAACRTALHLLAALARRSAARIAAQTGSLVRAANKSAQRRPVDAPAARPMPRSIELPSGPRAGGVGRGTSVRAASGSVNELGRTRIAAPPPLAARGFRPCAQRSARSAAQLAAERRARPQTALR